MKMVNKKYTIKDIALLAGVSKGTVDRVLHNRGKVSKKAHEKVEQVLKEIDYQPNPIAQNLKNNRVYRICVLMPDSREDSFWTPAHKGVMQASKEFKPFGVLIAEYFYDPYDKSSFLDKSTVAIDSSPDVLVMAPLFQKEAQDVFEKCRKNNILVALFNNHIDKLKGEIFIGQDLCQSGRVAASLIDKIVGHSAQIAIVHINMESHMALKEKGFVEYFTQKNSSHIISVHNFSTENSEVFKSEVMLFLKNNPNISAVFITNSKAYRLIDFLKQSEKKITTVGYDLLEKNIYYLKKGEIDFLIHQKPKRQAYLGIEYIAEHFLFGKKIPSHEFLPIDILTSENVKYYLE